MPQTTRSNNLDLIRWMVGGQKATAAKMANITNENYVSKMATGDRAISNTMARKIEKTFRLPESWLDRDNEKAIRMSMEDYEIFSLLAEYSPEAKKAIVDFLSLAQPK